jgi:hypothetical protein
VEQLGVGDAVWSADSAGAKLPATILKVSRVATEPGHAFVHVRLADGRELWASPGHPTSDGRTFAQLEPGDFLDGARVTLVESSHPAAATYDLLPSGGTDSTGPTESSLAVRCINESFVALDRLWTEPWIGA